MNEKKKKVEFVKVYNVTRNLGEIHRLEDGVDVSFQHFRVENNQEVICDAPEGEVRGTHFIPLPQDASDFSSATSISICEAATGKCLHTIPKSSILKVDETKEISVRNESTEIIDAMSKATTLSPFEKESLFDEIQKTSSPIKTLEGKLVSNPTIDQFAKAIGMILTNEADEFPEAFYKTVDPKEEFGIDRIVADKVYNLPRLLENATLIRQGETTTYIVQAEIKDSYQNSIRLEHRFQATSEDQAKDLGKLVVKRLKGIQLKIWTACWKMANTKSHYTFTCRLSDLMKYCSPSREAHFNSAERMEFYEHLRSLENTKFVYTQPDKRKKDKFHSYEVRLLEIHHRSGMGDGHQEVPQELTMTLLNAPALRNKKATFVGVGVKNRTLELHSDDMMLAHLVQTRKNQRMSATTLKFERESLMNVAGLAGTNKAKKGEANKLLIEKLKRLKEKGIILEHPQRIKDTITLKIR